MPETRRAAWGLIWQDSWLRALALWLPALLFALMAWLFHGGLLRELPIGVVDGDHSTLSRQLVRSVEASPVLAVTAQFESVAAGSAALQANRIMALLVLPAGLEKSTRRGEQPVVSAFYTGQRLLVGRQIAGALQQALGQQAVVLQTLRGLVQQPLPSALAAAAPIRVQSTALYNLSGNYGQFLLAGLLPALWQILILSAVICHWVRMESTLGPALYRHSLFTLLAPWLLIELAWGGVLLAVLRASGVLMLGHPGWVLLAQCLLVVACLLMGSLFYWLVRDGARAMSLAAGYAAPAFAFLGVTFPALDMPLLARVWRALLPASHYAEVQIGQSSQALLWSAQGGPLWALLAFVLVWPLVVLLQRRGRHVALA